MTKFKKSLRDEYMADMARDLPKFADAMEPYRHIPHVKRILSDYEEALRGGNLNETDITFLHGAMICAVEGLSELEEEDLC